MSRQQTTRTSRSKTLATGVSAFAAAIACIPLAHAQDAAPGGVAAILDEIIVTARKREEASQDVPMAISALGASQLDALKIRDLTNLSVRLPNVALDDVGTARGTANFSIRGLGINSSIPGIDPTVGVVIDGVYVGLNILSFNGIPAPGIDLSFLGAPGCVALVGTIDFTQPMVGLSPSQGVTLPIPPGITIGTTVYSQSVVLIPPNSQPNGQNAAGLLTSNFWKRGEIMAAPRPYSPWERGRRRWKAFI